MGPAGNLTGLYRFLRVPRSARNGVTKRITTSADVEFSERQVRKQKSNFV